jgi:WD40 repeat protein
MLCQVGKSAPCFLWDACTGEKLGRAKLPKNSREVSACAIRADGEYFATADKSNDHMVTIWTKGGDMVFCDKGGPDHIFDLSFGKDTSKIQVWSAGVKHFCYWDAEKLDKKKGIHGKVGPMTSHAAVTSDDKGTAYSGASNSGIYCWRGNTLFKVLYVHDKGFIGSINWVDGKLYSGGRDGNVCITNTETYECEKKISFGVLPRALDVKDNMMVVGLRNGSIIECNMDDSSMTTYMQSHNDGEVWGLA